MKRAYLILTLAALVRADTVDGVLARMDQAAKTFKSMSANVHRVDFSSVFSETNAEDGVMRFMKQPKGGVVLLVEFNGQNERKIRLANHTAEIYHPKANSEDVYDTREFTKSADLLILIGFGMSRADLLRDYDITLGGSETIGTKKTTRIDLKPKSKGKKEGKKDILNLIQLWIPDGEGNPIQEKILSGTESKDYNLLLFSNMKINPNLPDSDFELKLPAGVKSFKAGK